MWPAFSVSYLPYKKVKDRQHVSLNHLLGLSSVCSAANSFQIHNGFHSSLVFFHLWGRSERQRGALQSLVSGVSIRSNLIFMHTRTKLYISDEPFSPLGAALEMFTGKEEYPSFKWMLETHVFFLCITDWRKVNCSHPFLLHRWDGL